MRRLMAVLALAATLGLGAGVPAASAQMDPYGGLGYGAGYWPGSPVGPLAIPGPAPYGPYGVGGYAGWPGYGGVPSGSFPYYAWPLLSGVYNATGFPSFGLFPYLALNGNVANPSPYASIQPYAFFMGCTSTYTGSNFYVCR